MSGRVGRNDACPCGSGKKYKRCCLEAEANGRPSELANGGTMDAKIAHAAGLHALDRKLVDRILAFGVTEFEGWSPDELIPMDVEQPAASELVVPWSAYDARDADGRSMAEIFRSECALELSPRERAWLDAQSRTRLGIWEVVGVERGQSIRVRESLGDRERLVIERSASQTVGLHERILARVIDFDGISLFCGMHPRSLPPREGDELVRTLIDELAGKRARSVDREVLDEPGVGELMIELWEGMLDEIMNRPMPKLATTDGEDLVPIEERFVLARKDAVGAVRDAILSLPHAELEDGPADGSTRIAFVRPNPGGRQLDTTVLGHATITGDSLLMGTLSRERAASFREAIERVCGPLVRFASRKEQDPAELFAKMTAGSDAPRAPLGARAAPPPEVAEALRAVKERAYRDWCDTALPALGGKTPRQAMKGRSRKLRDEVHLLLREIERGESMVPPEERFDVDVLRQELGIPSAGS